LIDHKLIDLLQTLEVPEEHIGVIQCALFLIGFFTGVILGLFARLVSGRFSVQNESRRLIRLLAYQILTENRDLGLLADLCLQVSHAFVEVADHSGDKTFTTLHVY